MKNLLLINISFTDMDKSGNRIGIMGGTFDPIHIGHLAVAEKAREEFGLERVIFIPAGFPPHKKEFFSSAKSRLEMVKIATEGNPFFEFSSIEVDNKRKASYTYDTLTALEDVYKGFRIYLIVGEDSFHDLPNWHKHELLIKKATFLVARRKADRPFEIKGKRAEELKYHLISSPLLEISSSYIRDCFAGGKTVKYLVPEKVILYMRRNNLYGFKNST